MINPKVPMDIFIIDTESYTGNFERKITAYMTGVIIDYTEAGASVAIQFRDDYPELDFSKYIAKFNDEHGFLRPCSIWQTPGWFNHGRGGYFRDGDEEEAWKDYQEKVRKDSIGYASTKLDKCPAYLSVAIFFSEFPNEYKQLLIARANEFANSKNIKITGFRLISRDVKVIDKTIEIIYN